MSNIEYLYVIQAKYLTKKTQAGSVEAIRLLDELLLQLVVRCGALIIAFLLYFCWRK